MSAEKYGTPTLVNNQGATARTSAAEITIASKLWTIRWNPNKQRLQLLTFHRADSTDAKATTGHVWRQGKQIS